MRFIVAIDGTSSSGKTTTARILAKKLGIKYINTGSMYRCIALDVIRNNISIDDDESIKKRFSEIHISLSEEDCEEKVFLNGEDVTQAIRAPEVDRLVSVISEKPYVREFLVKIQRKMAENASVVCEGRDIGTVVFPDAEIKIFMTADIEERAKRRFKELKEKGISVSFEEVKRNLEERDRIDSMRKHSPLKKAPDAVVLDTTNLSIEEQVKFVEELIKRYKREK